ncbi:hypothetical protein Tco_1054266 [Tanacetum coccineum]|uniref:Uncharacterized protein n=1 Tax=Tanacetum coccineum TaxID=301880 RepID=A0ABQ5GX67_9ASTR
MTADLPSLHYSRSSTLCVRIMEMELDIKNMTLSEYWEYEAEKERQLRDNVRSKRSLTNYDEADFVSFH